VRSLITGFIFCFMMVLGMSAQVRLSDAIAVVVHTNLITARDIDSRIMPALNILYNQYQDKPDEMNKKALALRREAIEELVEQKLILQDFLDSKLQLPDNYVDQEVTRRIRENFGDRTTLVKTLQAQGLTYEGFYEHTRDDVIIQAMTGKNVDMVNVVSPQMILDYYNEHLKEFSQEAQVRIRTILLTKKGENRESVKFLASEILAMIKKGSDFEEIQQLYSEDLAMKGRKDAHLEWRSRSSLQEELANVAFSMRPGEISGLLETDAAFWIIKLEDFEPEHYLGIEDVRDSIDKKLRDQERARLRNNWIERLKKKYLVRYY